MITRRSAFAALAAAFAAPFAIAASAHAQAPAGAIPSTTAPSNSEGTPAGGTGVLSNSRVGSATDQPVQHTTRHHRRRRHHRRTSTTSGQ